MALASSWNGDPNFCSPVPDYWPGCATKAVAAQFTCTAIFPPSPARRPSDCCAPRLEPAPWTASGGGRGRASRLRCYRIYINFFVCLPALAIVQMSVEGRALKYIFPNAILFGTLMILFPSTLDCSSPSDKKERLRGCCGGVCQGQEGMIVV